MASKLTLFYAVLSLLWMVAIGTRDSRRCVDRLEGPLDEFNNSLQVVQLEGNRNNSFTVTIVCRITCEEARATYRPELRMVNTENGDFYQSSWHEGSHLFNITVPRSNNEFRCDPNDNVTDYEYHVTVISLSFNRSVAICGLHYISSDNRHSEFCFTDTLALITIRETDTPPTTNSDGLATTTASKGPTTTAGPTTTTSKGPTTTTASIGVSTSGQTGISGSTIAPIVVAIVTGLGVVILAVLLAVVVYKVRQRRQVKPKDMEKGVNNLADGVRDQGTQTPNDKISCAKDPTTQDRVSESDANTQVDNDAQTPTDIILLVRTTQDSTSTSQDETNRKHIGLVTMLSVNTDDGNT